VQILLVQENPQNIELRCALAAQDYVVKQVSCAGAAIGFMATERSQIIILDLDFPGDQGMCVLEVLRKSSPFAPILVLTCHDSVRLRNSCFDRGADVLLQKTVAVPELLARLRVLERWLTRSSNPVIKIGNVSIDTVHHSVFVDGREVPMPRKEYMLLKTMMNNAGHVQSRQFLEMHLYNWDEEISSNALEVYVHNLRRKLGRNFIRTVRGLGYKVSGDR